MAVPFILYESLKMIVIHSFTICSYKNISYHVSGRFIDICSKFIRNGGCIKITVYKISNISFAFSI